jgi:hypothetical protein
VRTGTGTGAGASVGCADGDGDDDGEALGEGLGIGLGLVSEDVVGAELEPELVDDVGWLLVLTARTPKAAPTPTTTATSSVTSCRARFPIESRV